MNKKFNRLFLGGLIALLGGISFGITVLPSALEQFLTVIPPESDLRLARLVFPAAFLWIPGGAITALQGGGRNGLKVMGIAGLIIGLIYGFIIGGGDLPVIGVTAVVAGLYSAGAGLLIGGGLPRGEDDLTDEHGT